MQCEGLALRWSESGFRKLKEGREVELRRRQVHRQEQSRSRLLGTPKGKGQNLSYLAGSNVPRQARKKHLVCSNAVRE